MVITPITSTIGNQEVLCMVWRRRVLTPRLEREQAVDQLTELGSGDVVEGRQAEVLLRAFLHHPCLIAEVMRQGKEARALFGRGLRHGHLPLGCIAADLLRDYDIFIYEDVVTFINEQITDEAESRRTRGIHHQGQRLQNRLGDGTRQ